LASSFSANGIFAYNAFFFGALAELPAGRPPLIIATNPAVTTMPPLLLDEPLLASMFVGGVVTLAGVSGATVPRKAD
jgi:hypothetical protein